MFIFLLYISGTKSGNLRQISADSGFEGGLCRTNVASIIYSDHLAKILGFVSRHHYKA